MNIQTVKYIADIETPTEYTGYLVDGNMSVPLAESNGHYREVQEWAKDLHKEVIDGEIKYLPNVIEPAFTEAEVLAYQITLAKTSIDSYIHSEVSRYNKENHVDFGSIHNVASYINSPTYTHYSWCVAVWDWSVTVWETARAIQGEIFTGIRPMVTVDELLAELPVFTYTA